MDLSMENFLAQVTANPLLLIAVLLTLGVILVNGWTDAPNAIATCVVTRCMSARAAILMAAVFNFLGVFLMSMLNATVAETITKMVDFGTNSHEAIVALSAALFAIVVWATLAWYFGIPTSESHALIAGLTGGAIALHGGLSGVNPAEWVKVLYGLVISVVMGFGLGYLMCKLVVALFRKAERPKTEGFFKGAQIFGAACMSFMHGAQDGQKFLGLFLLAGGGGGEKPAPALAAVCGLTMAFGTLMGGRRIVEHVGKDLVELSPRSGLAADLGGGAALGLCTVLGLPVSTTHAKTAAILGAGTAGGARASVWATGGLVLAWGLTFPVCALLGFLLTQAML